MLLFLLVAVLVVVGILRILDGDVWVGLALIAVACLLGPGGYTILR